VQFHAFEMDDCVGGFSFSRYSSFFTW
jgi:hypothetical protein